jgi:SAM-dependent methyltransferase
METPEHYNAAYFAWQQSVGETGAALEKWKFSPFLSPSDSVLEFGCGGAYLLCALTCRERWGIDINPAARLEAQKSVNAVRTVNDLPEEMRFDKIISNHALEHVETPITELRALRERLSPQGRLIFVVPSETWRMHKHFDPLNKNQHLHTWTPLLLGNLLVRAGFRVERTELLCNRWPPRATFLMRILPLPIVHLIARTFAAVSGYRELRVVASSNSYAG